jgi:hypothetical protein
MMERADGRKEERAHRQMGTEAPKGGSCSPPAAVGHEQGHKEKVVVAVAHHPSHTVVLMWSTETANNKKPPVKHLLHRHSCT